MRATALTCGDKRGILRGEEIEKKITPSQTTTCFKRRTRVVNWFYKWNGPRKNSYCYKRSGAGMRRRHG